MVSFFPSFPSFETMSGDEIVCLERQMRECLGGAGGADDDDDVRRRLVWEVDEKGLPIATTLGALEWLGWDPRDPLTFTDYDGLCWTTEAAKVWPPPTPPSVFESPQRWVLCPVPSRPRRAILPVRERIVWSVAHDDNVAHGVGVDLFGMFNDDDIGTDLGHGHGRGLPDRGTVAALEARGLVPGGPLDWVLLGWRDEAGHRWELSAGYWLCTSTSVPACTPDWRFFFDSTPMQPCE